MSPATVARAHPRGKVTSASLQSARLTPGAWHSRKTKAVPMRAKAQAIIEIPTKRSNRLPYWSTRHTVKSVANNFTKPTPTEESAAADPKPADLNMFVAKYNTEGCPVTCCRNTRPHPITNGRGYRKESVHLATSVPMDPAISWRMTSNSWSTSQAGVPARKNPSALRASSSGPGAPPASPSRTARSTRYRGDCGMKVMPTACTSANAAETTTMRRQPT
mmetsp:Transcript_26643/g.80302  ORF Transcript_26643/g.80302 Transcript_26643/m.80302 type:complete len:219 (+) Transcript_26643:378-1034(+)